MHVAFGEDPAVVDQQDVRRHRLDLVQDVARDEDALARRGAQSLIRRMVLRAHQRIHAGQRLVENQQLGIVHQRLRQLDALPHALAVGADLLVGGVHQIDRARARAARRASASRRSRPFSAHQRRDPFEARSSGRRTHPAPDRSRCGEYSAGLPQIGSPSTRIAPLLGLSCPVISFMNVDLPAPFGPSRPVMPGGTMTVTSLRPDDLAVPLRQMFSRDDRDLP